MSNRESVYPCPCGHASKPTFFGHSSNQGLVNYYRCRECGVVWTVPKDAPGSAPTIIVGPAEGSQTITPRGANQPAIAGPAGRISATTKS